MKKNILSIYGMAFLCLVFLNVHAQWSTNSTINTLVSAATVYQEQPISISDEAGGAIIVWKDKRSNSNYGIYVQKINASGIAVWTKDGVEICKATDYYNKQTIISDGQGGAIIAWVDNRMGTSTSFNNIYAQRINSAGEIQWTSEGVAVCSASNGQSNPKMVSNGFGGAIITWQDDRVSGTDIYAQNINSNGLAQWVTDGAVVSTAPSPQVSPQIISDRLGGAIIAWEDQRGANYDIYSQRISAAGVAQWAVNGVMTCTVTNAQYKPVIASDGADGAIIAWYDYRNTTASNYDIYAQKINGSGINQWGVGGVVISTAVDRQEFPLIVSDGVGGAFITWNDYRNGNYDIYAQRVASSGQVSFASNGMAICSLSGTQEKPDMISDGLNGAIITWKDYRNGNYDVYAQRLDTTTGAIKWAVDGVGICTQSSGQDYPTIATDGTGGAIIAWEDSRGNYDIYAQNICSAGLIGGIAEPADINGPTGMCSGTTNTYFITAVAGATSYSWSLPAGWTGSSTNNSISIVAGTKGGQLSVKASNACGFSSPSLLDVNIKKAISGKVYYEGNPVSNNSSTIAHAYKYSINKAMILLDSSSIDANGKYTLSNLESTDSTIVYINPDTNFYTNAIGTYYNNSFDWSTATKVIPSCPATTANITLITPQKASGAGIISGRIVEGQGFGKRAAAGDGISGVQVGLKKKPGGQLGLMTTTNNNGDYDLKNIPDGEYTMYVGLPGLPLATEFTVAVSPTTKTFSDVNFEADSNKIETTGSLSIIAISEKSSIKIYPNPAKESINILLESTEENELTITLIDLLGKTMKILQNNTLQQNRNSVVQIDVSDLADGMYWLNIKTNNKSFTQKISIVN